MNKRTGIIIGVIAVAFLSLVGISLLQSQSTGAYDLSQVITVGDESGGQTGGFGDIIEGDPNAPVVIFEYGDYQCTACAPMNPYINELVEEYDGKVAVVFRTLIMSYHQNGTAAASAALAAARQGYWKEYKDELYDKQDDWYYSDAIQRQQQFEQYFQDVTGGKGNLGQFRADMASSEVAQKLKFDAKLSDQANIEWTPTFYLGDELIDQRGMSRDDFLTLLREKIDARLAEL